MMANASTQTVQTLEILKEELIAASVEIVFETVLDQLGPASELSPGVSMAMKLEPWPGGRWYRDLGNNAGHLWGQVQVIKPPLLLELCGPMFMSYPAISHVQYRLVAEGSNARLKIAHRAIGLITQEHREGVVTGWEDELKLIRDGAERRVASNGRR